MTKTTNKQTIVNTHKKKHNTWTELQTNKKHQHKQQQQNTEHKQDKQNSSKIQSHVSRSLPKGNWAS